MLQMNKSTFTVCLLFMVFMVSGCSFGNTPANNLKPYPTSMREVGDGGFLSGESCGPPCFFNITPNITSEEQAKEILKSFYALEDCEDWDRSKEGGIRRIVCPSTATMGNQYISIGFDKSNKFNFVSFVPHDIITVQDVVNKYGDPSGVYVAGDTDDGSTPTSVLMILSYDAIKTELNLPWVKAKTYPLLPSTPIEVVSYNETTHNSFDVSWKGFQEYSLTVR